MKLVLSYDESDGYTYCFPTYEFFEADSLEGLYCLITDAAKEVLDTVSATDLAGLNLYDMNFMVGDVMLPIAAVGYISNNKWVEELSLQPLNKFFEGAVHKVKLDK